MNTKVPKHDVKDMITTPTVVVFNRKDIDYTKLHKCINNECNSGLCDIKCVG